MDNESRMRFAPHIAALILPMLSLAGTAAADDPADEDAMENLEGRTAAGLNAAHLLPIGVPSTNVRMPDFEEDILVSWMRVGTLTRIDHDELDMIDLRLESYLPDGTLDYVVIINRGFYQIASGQLVSRTPTRIEGRGFFLEGEGCDYQPDSPIIKILGNIHSEFSVQREDPPQDR